MNVKECKQFRRSEDGLIKFCDSREVRAATGRYICTFTLAEDCPECMFYESVDETKVKEDGA